MVAALSQRDETACSTAYYLRDDADRAHPDRLMKTATGNPAYSISAYSLRGMVLPRGHRRRGLFDKGGYRGWLRHIDGVAGGDLGHRGTGPLGHETLSGRRDHLVFGGEQVPALVYKVGPGGSDSPLSALTTDIQLIAASRSNLESHCVRGR